MPSGSLKPVRSTIPERQRQAMTFSGIVMVIVFIAVINLMNHSSTGRVD